MESVRFDRERGQILVQVAIMVGVLFAFAALAVDAGNVYGGRRRMQNAADAGALAGARAICFPTDGIDPQDAAVDYAERNGARPEDVQVTIDDYTAIVTAAQTLDTFFAGVIGINEANVRAEAAAACGGSLSAGDLWPLAFNESAYTETITCGQEFMVFASKDASWKGLDCAGEGCECVEPGSGITGTVESDSECYDQCNCNAIGPHIRTSGLGWLLFPDPGEPYELSNWAKCPGVNACGSGRVACWLGNDYPGVIEVPGCIAGQEGVVADTKIQQGVEDREGQIVQVPLWDDEICTDVQGPCPGNKNYHVVGFGCVQVVGYVAPGDEDYNLSIPKCGDPDATCDPGANLHIVKGIKICDDTTGYVNDEGKPVIANTADPPYELINLYDQFCSSPTGSTTGVPPDEWETRSVSLIQWP